MSQQRAAAGGEGHALALSGPRLPVGKEGHIVPLPGLRGVGRGLARGGVGPGGERTDFRTPTPMSSHTVCCEQNASEDGSKESYEKSNVNMCSLFCNARRW